MQRITVKDGSAVAGSTPPSRQSPPEPAWQQVLRGVVVTEDAAEAALAAMEDHRMYYGAAQAAAAERIAQVAPELGRPDLFLRAGLISADITLRHGGVVEAAASVEEILGMADSIGDAFAMARSHFLLCEIQHSLGDSPSARINGIRSVELLPADTAIGVRVDHLRALGTSYGPGLDSRRCHAQALDLTNLIGDAARAIAIHNSYSYFAFVVNDYVTAKEHADQMEELSRRRGIPLVASQLDTVARVLMMVGRNEAAIDYLRPLIPHAGDPTRAGGIEDLDPKPYGVPEAALTLAEAHRALGRFRTAQQALDVAFQLARDRHLGRFHGHVNLAQARLYAEIGDFERAYHANVAYHQAVVELQSGEMETRSRMVQASYDAEERLRDVQNFRELAMRDPLTGLYNRRFLDDALNTSVRAARLSEQPLSVAIADADFFKRVNDLLSHQVGDEVLRTLASVLATAVRGSEVVGRLGGEEFLILLPGTDASTALTRCEAIRRAVDDHDFSPVTGTLPVTISIGVATATVGQLTPAELLAAADHNLYAAKRSGRNRVMGAAVG